MSDGSRTTLVPVRDIMFIILEVCHDVVCTMSQDSLYRYAPMRSEIQQKPESEEDTTTINLTPLFVALPIHSAAALHPSGALLHLCAHHWFVQVLLPASILLPS